MRRSVGFHGNQSDKTAGVARTAAHGRADGGPRRTGVRQAPRLEELLHDLNVLHPAALDVRGDALVDILDNQGRCQGVVRVAGRFLKISKHELGILALRRDHRRTRSRTYQHGVPAAQLGVFVEASPVAAVVEQVEAVAVSSVTAVRYQEQRFVDGERVLVALTERQVAVGRQLARDPAEPFAARGFLTEPVADQSDRTGLIGVMRAERANHLRASGNGNCVPKRTGVFDRVAEKQLETAAVRIHRPQCLSREDVLFDAVIPAGQQHATVVHDPRRVIAVDVVRHLLHITAVAVHHVQQSRRTGLASHVVPRAGRDKHELAAGQLHRTDVPAGVTGDLFEVLAVDAHLVDLPSAFQRVRRRRDAAGGKEDRPSVEGKAHIVNRHIRLRENHLWLGIGPSGVEDTDPRRTGAFDQIGLHCRHSGQMSVFNEDDRRQAADLLGP